jgi:chromosome partitioning protein
LAENGLKMAVFDSFRKNQSTALNTKAHIVVIGNEKGGSGKSTTAMHVAVGIMIRGLRVATIDLDSRQGTFSRYISNRKKYAQAANSEVLIPEHYMVEPTPDGEKSDAGKEKLRLLIEGAMINHDVVIIDTPGSDSAISRLAHSYADTLITPLNDSLVDFDVLAHVDGQKMTVMGPSHYSEMVWEQKKEKAERDQGTVDWIVLRNRVSSLDNHNAQEVSRLVSDLSKRIGFRIVLGFSERVIFRELFLLGLTILDLKDASGVKALSPSHLAARDEVMTIVNAIGVSVKK